MQNLETTVISYIIGGVISMVFGLVLRGISGTIGTIKSDIESLYKMHNKSQSQLDKLQGEHDALCKKHR